MIGFRPDHVGLTESEKLSSLYPDWLGIQIVPGKLLESAFCAEAYWSKYENTDALWDAANDDIAIVAFGTMATNIVASGIFIPGPATEGLLIRSVVIEGMVVRDISTEAVFGSDIVALGVLEACDGG